jgi:CRP-like cAMP-binding protein
MAESLNRNPSENRILAHLSAEDFALLASHLTPTDLPLRKQLEAINKPIEHVYFIEKGFASVVANGHGRGVEVGLIGREGMTGLAVIMATDRSPHETYMQLAGAGQQMAAAHLSEMMDKSSTLRRALLNFGHTFLVQTASTALANSRSKIEERLARWLLMASDRAGQGLNLTHEFLAIMLGVRRPGVTIAMSFLEGRGLIHTQRRVISILDREGLEGAANGAYGAAEAEFSRLFGS